MRYRCILPDWAVQKYSNQPKVVEGNFTSEEVTALNDKFYNIYWFPNYPSDDAGVVNVSGHEIDTFDFVFVDMDLKDGLYTKESFLELIVALSLPPTLIVDSGNGIHIYWKVSDLNAMDFLRIQRRLIKHLKTDPAVAKICQIMRYPGTLNTKKEEDFKSCDLLDTQPNIYTCEQLDGMLPIITPEDEQYCQNHYNKTYKASELDIKIDVKLPMKFVKLVRDNPEVKKIWSGAVEDRSKADFRLGHIMWSSGFSKDEARSVLVNTSKSSTRAPIHRISYANGIIDQVWAFESPQDQIKLELSETVKEILSKSGDTIEGVRFPCWNYVDGTERGFRLGQVVGLVAGSGVGKTTMALNMFKGFVQSNPDYDHFFIPLEQPKREIAERWRILCGTDTHLHEKVHVLSNYDEDGNFRHLSFDDIKEYILAFQKQTKRKIGCVVIDHIGALHKKTKDGENQGLMDICHEMKAFAINTNTLLIMQSQSTREKAGIGDIELNKDAAYGTMYFEAYTDYLMTIWQPLKRCYANTSCPTVMAYKFCKIRHKKKGADLLSEDTRYLIMFDPETGGMRELNQEEEIKFKHYNNVATNLRKQDSKKDVLTYVSNLRRPDSSPNSGRPSAA